MNNATHTPGPWAACMPGYGWQVRGQDDGSGPDASRFGALVAECHANAQKADAYLIAAAPDLLAALQEMVALFADHAQYDDEGHELAAVTAAQSAIAKAKGE